MKDLVIRLKVLAKREFKILYQFQIILVIYSISSPLIADTVHCCNPNPTNMGHTLLEGPVCTRLTGNKQAVNESVCGFAYVCVQAMESVLLLDLKVPNGTT